MLLCEPPSSPVSDPEDAPTNSVLLNKSGRTSALGLLGLQLDDLRGALAKRSADYADAIRTAAALRDALVRSDLRNRRSEAEAKRQGQAAASAREGFDLARQREQSAGTALANCEALLQRRDRTLEEQGFRIEEVQRKAAEVADHCASQRALVQEYQERLAAQDRRLKLLEATLVRHGIKPAARAWFWRLGPFRQPSCSAQNL